MSNLMMQIDEFLEELLGPVVGELGVQVARYIVREWNPDTDEIMIGGGLKTLADKIGMTGRGRIEELSAVLDALSELRLKCQGRDTWLLMWSRTPRAIFLTVGPGLDALSLETFMRVHLEDRAQVRLTRMRIVRVRA
jgi:hypothetical protein